MLPLVIGLMALATGLLARALRRRGLLAERRELERAQAVLDRRRVMEFMQMMVEALGEGLSRPELLQRIVHASVLCTGALSACIYERTEGGALRAGAAEGLFPPQRPMPDSLKESLPTRARFIERALQPEEIAEGEGIVGRVAATGRAERVADASSVPGLARHGDPSLAIRSLIAVPLCFRGRFFGVLVVANPVEDRAFTEMEFSLMQSLAGQASLALHNLEFLNLEIERKQIDLDLSIARGIQQMLLPSLSFFPQGLDLDARYTPAQQVGGDLYDIFTLPDGRLGVAVGDVSGKGISASLLMAICRTNLRQIAPRHASPSAALAEMNRAMARDMRPDLFVTLLYAVIDTAGDRVVLARAGHELPLLAGHDPATGASVTHLARSEGMALGMVPDEYFASSIADVEECFRPGDALVLFTDGVTESPNEEEKEFSSARLADVVRTLHDRSAREINDGIVAAIRRFGGDTPQRDDLTLVTVKRTAGAGA